MSSDKGNDLAGFHDSLSIFAESVTGLRNQLITQGWAQETAEQIVLESIRSQGRKKEGDSNG